MSYTVQSYALHQRIVNEINDLKKLDNIFINSDGVLYSDSSCQNVLELPISLELVTLQSIRVLKPVTITLSDINGLEVYRATPLLVDDFNTVHDGDDVVVWEDVLNKPDFDDIYLKRGADNNFMPYNEFRFRYSTFTDPDSGVQRDLKAGDKGIATVSLKLGSASGIVKSVSGVLSASNLLATEIPVLDASKITTGTFDLARIPALPSSNTIVCSTIPAMSVPDQALVAKGTIVIESSTGNTYRYSGSGSVILNSSYILCADVSPDWSVITNRPSNVSYFTNDSGYLTSASNIAWSKISNTPTTLAGYGITDALTTSYIPSWASISGKPNTLAGYGIASTDILFDSKYAPNVHNQAWSTITSVPVASTSTSGVLTSTDWNAFNGKMNTNGSNAATSVRLATAVESNEILTVQNAGSSILVNSPAIGSALRSAIRFNWYSTDWQIGNIRGTSTDSVGFGIALSGGSNLRWRTTNGTTYDYNNLEVTGTIKEGGVLLSDKYASKTHNHAGVYQPVGDYSVNGHTHNYLPLSGGTLFGAVTFANGTWNTVGDDVQIGDINSSNTLGLRGAQNNSVGYIKYGAGPSVGWSGTSFNIPSIFFASQNSLFEVRDYISNSPANEWVWFGYNGMHANSSRYAGFMASNVGEVIASARYGKKGYLNAENVENTTDNVCDWNIDRFYVYKNLEVAGTIKEGGVLLSDKYASKTHTHLWADITDKPSTFTPSAHTHVIADVTGLQTALDWKQPLYVNQSGSGAFDFNSFYSRTNVNASIFYGSYTNAPPSWSHGSLIQGMGANSNWTTQLAIGTGDEGLYFRRSYDPGAVWGPWRTVWHSGNLTPAAIGAATVASLANYLPTAGGTMGASTGASGGISWADGGSIRSAYGASTKSLIVDTASLRLGDGAGAWDYAQWCGIKYVHSSLALYIGGCDAANTYWPSNSYDRKISVNFVNLSSYDALTVNGEKVWNAGNLTPAAIGAAPAEHTHAGVYLGIGAKAADSNLLDGIDSSRFVYGTNGFATSDVGGNFATINKSGFYNTNVATDSPVASTWTHLIHSNYNGDDYWAWQLAANFGAGVGTLEEYFTRLKTAGNYGAWRKIWTSLDFGATDIANWNSKADGNHNHTGVYQPLENQRLSTTNSVTFAEVDVGAGNLLCTNLYANEVRAYEVYEDDVRLSAKYGRLANTNTWSEINTFNKGITLPLQKELKIGNAIIKGWSSGPAIYTAGSPLVITNTSTADNGLRPGVVVVINQGLEVYGNTYLETTNVKFLKERVGTPINLSTSISNSTATILDTYAVNNVRWNYEYYPCFRLPDAGDYKGVTITILCIEKNPYWNGPALYTTNADTIYDTDGVTVIANSSNHKVISGNMRLISNGSDWYRLS